MQPDFSFTGDPMAQSSICSEAGLCPPTTFFGYTTGPFGHPIQVYTISFVVPSVLVLTIHHRRLWLLLLTLSFWHVERSWNRQSSSNKEHFLDCHHSQSDPHNKFEELRVRFSSAKGNDCLSSRAYPCLFAGSLFLTMIFYPVMPCLFGIFATTIVQACVVILAVLSIPIIFPALHVPIYLIWGLSRVAAETFIQISPRLRDTAYDILYACAPRIISMWTILPIVLLYVSNPKGIVLVDRLSLNTVREILAPIISLALAQAISSEPAFTHFALIIATSVASKATPLQHTDLSDLDMVGTRACHFACPFGRSIVGCTVESAATYFTGCDWFTAN